MMASKSQTNTPQININIQQPGDRGEFVIQVVDGRNRKVICENRMPENVNYLQYLYTAQLLEAKSAEAAINALNRDEGVQDDSWMQSDRYQDMVRYGQKLYSDLFGNGKNANKFRKYFRKEKDFRDGVRFMLQLDKTASELWNIPWEYIHDGEQFLAIEGNHSIVRRPIGLGKGSLDKWASIRSIPRPLRILFVIADPTGASPLNIDQEVNMMLKALEPARRKELVTIDYIEEGSLANIEYALAERDYHVLHYSGHGAMVRGGSCLLLEDMEGNPDPAFIRDLLPILKNHPSMRLVFLSGCQTGQIDETQATSGVATGLLEVIPAVVAMQFSILDISASVFNQAFYGAVGNGETLEMALQIGRNAMYQQSGELADWGIPALYQQSSNIQLVDPSQPSSQLAEKAHLRARGLRVPKVFISRRNEIRQLRNALRWSTSTAFIWGMGGVGKSALAGRLIERPGIRNTIETALIIRCDKTPPQQIVPMLIQWLESVAPQAAEAMKNTQIPLHERVASMVSLLPQKRFVLVFDRFERYMKEHPEQRRWWIPHKEMSLFFRALASSNWPGLIMFTSRYRWAFLNELAPDNHLEMHLDSMGMWATIMLCKHLPALKKADFNLYKIIEERVGGHARTLYTIDKLYAEHGRRLLLKQESLVRQLAQFWKEKFLGDALSRLNEREKQTLVGISILESTFWAGQVQIIANVEEREQAEMIMARWEALSLAHYVYSDGDGDPWYEIHDLVRAFLLDMLKSSQRQQLHARAAQMIEISLARTAWQRHEEHGGPRPPQQTFRAARFELGQIIEHAHPMFVQHSIQRALGWRQHYLACGEYEKANDIVTDIWHIVAFTHGNKRLAKQLLEEAMETSEGRDHHIAKVNYASILASEGNDDDAMRIYQQAYKAFEKLNDKNNMAVILGKEASYYQRQGNLKKAIQKQSEALKLDQERGNRRHEASTLTQLANLYNQNDDKDSALKMILMAEQIARDEGALAEYGIAVYTRGLIHKQYNQVQKAFEAFSISLEIAEKRGDPKTMAGSLSEIGNILRYLRRYDEAAKCMLQAINLSEQLQDYANLAVKLWRLAEIYSETGVIGEAEVLAERALKNAEQYRPVLVKDIKDFQRKLRRMR